MNYNITHNNINNLDYDVYFSKYVNSGDNDDFFQPSGKQHYRFLSYLSSLFQNAVIFDIGTHRGFSALSLSYNKTNTIHSFDITDVLHEKIRNIYNQNNERNVHFHIENLLDPEIFQKWKDQILVSPFIFFDIEPHNGILEWQFLELLKSIDYKGFVVFDDIWYFQGMRNEFWHKIEDKYKYDLTEFGHWSGTGIVTFNHDITFNKRDNSCWTLVTAYFNLTKCPDSSKEIMERDQNHYLSNSLGTLSLPYNLIIYCDSESYPKIKERRPAYLESKTKYYIRDFDDFVIDDKTFREYRSIINENRKKNPYYFDNRNTASYYLFCMSRYVMLKEAIRSNPFSSSHFAWINICVERMGFKNLVYLDEALGVKRDKFSTCYIDYIPQEIVQNTAKYFEWGRCGMCSGFFTGNTEYMYMVCDLIEKQFLHYLRLGYGHADEQLYSAVYFEKPELFEHYYGDYFEMITNYKYIHDRSEIPINIFIKNSFQNKNYVKCFEACEFVFESYCLNKCTINNDDLTKLYYYYMTCKKFLRK